MWILLDLILLAIVLLFVITSAKKGFAKTFIEFVGFILAIYLSTFIGGAVATKVYDSTIEPKIIETVKETVGETTSSTVNDTVDLIWEDLPPMLTSSASFFGVDTSEVKESLNTQIAQKVDVELIAKSTAEKVVKPIFITIVKSVVSVILFAVLMFVVKIVAKIVNKIFKLPLVGTINSALGALLGLGKGAIIATVFCAVIGLVVALTENGFWIFTKENIDKTYIFSLLSNLKLFNF